MSSKQTPKSPFFMRFIYPYVKNSRITGYLP